QVRGELTAPGEVRLIRLLPGPIERVWEFLTVPEKRARWFADGPMELRAGGAFRLKFDQSKIAPDEAPPAGHECAGGDDGTMPGRVLRCEPPRLLSHTFAGESEVTFELMPQGKQVLMVLTHRSRGGDLPRLPNYSAGWHTCLMQLIALLESAPRPPFWPSHARLQPEYAKMLAR
ncbi:MAG: SRPBCC family protein, partial [Verrucomicrobiota bacterium]